VKVTCDILEDATTRVVTPFDSNILRSLSIDFVVLLLLLDVDASVGVGAAFVSLVSLSLLYR
jgi:hypothetical protein